MRMEQRNQMAGIRVENPWNQKEMKRYLTAIAILPLVFAIGGLLAYIATKYEEIETKDKERQ